ncbi:DUF6933 domain-containing protein [Cerasicoccus fimbriatus]|uniref:DUF6933 domain-containing protein n=1 Tax=Cerasicoccus fimbriatus TaxID=3014554 RepID=UPI0022B3FC68|nr:hypothetical protein [Cerasicoccus sp. TK19100]
MIYRLTHKLAKKIYEKPESTLEPNPNHFCDWAADYFTSNRTGYILLTHTKSMLSAAFYGKGVNDDDAFIKQANEAIRDCLYENGFEFVFESLMVPNLSPVHFSKVGNRQLSGIMVDLVRNAKWNLSREDLTPFDLAAKLNEIPQCTQKNAFPIKAFAALQANPDN